MELDGDARRGEPSSTVLPWRSALRGIGLAAVLTLLSVGCVGPARSSGSYRGKAANTADHVRSSVETTILGIEASDRHGVPAAYSSVLFGEAEADASSAADTFASVQPPGRTSDKLRSNASTLFQDAVDALATVRIDARRGDFSALEGELAGLHHISRQLDRAASRYRRQ